VVTCTKKRILFPHFVFKFEYNLRFFVCLFTIFSLRVYSLINFLVLIQVMLFYPFRFELWKISRMSSWMYLLLCTCRGLVQWVCGMVWDLRMTSGRWTLLKDILTKYIPRVRRNPSFFYFVNDWVNQNAFTEKRSCFISFNSWAVRTLPVTRIIIALFIQFLLGFFWKILYVENIYFFEDCAFVGK